MPFTLESPRWLWLLLPSAATIWTVALVWPVTRGAARWAAAATRTILMAGMLLGLAGPIYWTSSAAVSAVVLLDVSTSIPDHELVVSRDLIRRVSRAATAPHELRLVRFATDAAEFGPLPQGDASDLATSVSTRPGGADALGTDIARALGLAAGLVDPARTGRVLLVSDGRATRGDALALAGRLAALGIRVDYIPLLTANSGDVAIRTLSAPGDVRPHETFPLAIRLASDRTVRIALTLKRDGRPLPDGPDQAGPLQRKLTLAPGETTVTWTTRVEGLDAAVFDAEVQSLDAADPHPENNRGILAVQPLVPPRALVVRSTTVDAEPLVTALRTQAIAVDMRPPGRGLDAATLAGADLVVLADISRTALSDASVRALEAYVRDGGGLLVTGGPHAFGPGGWSGSPLEPLLPVRLDAPARRDEPTLALALVIDRSGSMSGAKMELTKEAARATAALLPPDDQLAVIAFDSQATVIVPMQRAANRQRIATNIGRIQPTGGTNILVGLREAVDQLSGTQAKAKHAILLSDGQSAIEGIAELVDAATGSRITISTVGVGDGVDEALLQLIAGRGGGRYYHARDPASIPRIFTREASEVAATGIIERPTTAVPRKHAPMLEGIGLDHAPRLGGYVRTHVRAQAELLLATDGGDPLLARWPVGLGQVVAWTSDLGTRWADNWARWPAFPKFWAQIARANMRTRAAQRFPLEATVENGSATVSVDAVGPDDHFLAGMDGTLEIIEVGPGGVSAAPSHRRIPLTESAPGRYEARFPVEVGVDAGGGATGAGSTAAAPTSPRALLLRGTLTRDTRPVARADASLSIPLAPEFLPVGTSNDGMPNGADLLAEIATRTGGGRLPTPEDVFRGAPARRTSRPLGTPLLAAMAVLFVVDVAIRRLAGMRRARPPASGPTNARA